MDIFNNINMNRFLFSLQYMWKGMLAIFIVIAVIILAVYALNFIIGRVEVAKKKKAEKQGSEN